MRDAGASLLTDFWYLALPGRALAPGRMAAKRLLGEPVLIARARDGAPFALRDICPHRGIPLRHGSFDGREVTCAYHGWRFAPDGHCTAIPSLVPGQAFDPGRVRVRAYPCRDVQGNIWVYIGGGAGADGAGAGAGAGGGAGEDAALPPVPELPEIGAATPKVTISSIFPCHTDHAAFGLMDPTHAAFVHTSWWWKRQARTLRQKEKHFEPAPLGWRMKRHRLPPENLAYKPLGANVTTEITYCLPGLRIEHIKGDRHSAVALTAITPIDERTTEVHQCLYWTMPWLAPFKPLIRHFARLFLEQDRRVVVLQQEGLAERPPLMLIDDADTQAKWYARVKREWLRAREEGRAFENPLRARTLRWRS